MKIIYTIIGLLIGSLVGVGLMGAIFALYIMMWGPFWFDPGVIVSLWWTPLGIATIVGIFRGYRHGKKLEIELPQNPLLLKKAWRTLFIVILIWVGVMGTIVVVVTIMERQSEQKRLELIESEQRRTTLIDEFHKITKVEPVLRGNLSGFDVAINTQGVSTGYYKLSLELKKLGYPPILTREKQIEINNPSSTQLIFISYSDILRGFYDAEILIRAVPGVIWLQEDLDMTIVLAPMLTPDERTTIKNPDFESGYTSVFSSHLPIDFYVDGATQKILSPQ